MEIHVVADFAESFSGDVHADHQSKESIQRIISVVRSMGHACSYFGGVEDLMKAHLSGRSFPQQDLFLNLSDGLDQKYRMVQSALLLEMLKVSYSGHDAFSLALACNKHYAKRVVEDCGCCRVPVGRLFTKDDPNYDRLADLPYPCIVKPNCEGGSLGITKESVVHDAGQASCIVSMLLQRFDEVLVEELIEGMDATNMIIGNAGRYVLNEAIGYSLDGKFYQTDSIRDFQTKRTCACTKLKLEDCGLPAQTVESIHKASEAIFEAIGSRDIARIDYRITCDGTPVFLEINALPSLEPKGPFMTLFEGQTFDTFIETYVRTVLERHALRMVGI